jgi:hypothetical protein
VRKNAVPYRLLPVLLLLFVLHGCGGSSSGEEVLIDFTLGSQGWMAGFSDYPVGQEKFFELDAGYRPLPAPLDAMGSALFITGNNHSDDLFMFYKGKIGGLEPGKSYRASFTVEFATNVPQGCVGIGGSPGESVFVKGGASEVEPVAVNAGGYYRMNVDKGEQSNGGASAVVLGDVANSQDCGIKAPQWELKTVSGGGAVEVTADAEGSLWLFVGTDSGFEGTTSLYYTNVRAILD